MATACVQDTNSIDLEQDSGGVLSADLRLDPAGALGVTAAGVKVVPASTSMQIVSNQLAMKIQGPKLTAAAAGVAGVSIEASTGWQPGDADDTTTHSATIARGATAQVGVTLTLGPFSVAQSVSTRILFVAIWSGLFQTTFSEFGTSAINDSVSVYLQMNYNGAGWVNAAKDSLNAFRQAKAFQLRGERGVSSVSAASTHTMQARIVSQGGTSSTTAIQGALQTSYYRGIVARY